VIHGGAVGIATGYGLDGPGIEYQWGRDYLLVECGGPPSIKPQSTD